MFVRPRTTSGNRNRVSPNQIYTDDELLERIKQLPSDSQKMYLKAVQKILTKESQVFLKMISESRSEISDVNEDIHCEQEVLRQTFDKLATTKLNAIDETPLSQFMNKRQNRMEQGATAAIHLQGKDKKAVQEYLRAVGREQTLPVNDGASYARPISADKRPTSGYRVRLSDMPLPPVGKEKVERESTIVNFTDKQEAAMANEQKQILDSLEKQGTHAEQERKRQADLLAAKKAARRFKKQQQELAVDELMAQSQGAEEQQLRDKERQENLVKEKLAKKKLARAKSQKSLNSESIDHPDEEELVAAGEGEGEKKKKKKKRSKSKNREPEAFDFPDPALEREPTAVMPEDDKSEKKKKKKKKKAEDMPNTEV